MWLVTSICVPTPGPGSQPLFVFDGLGPNLYLAAPALNLYLATPVLNLYLSDPSPQQGE